MDDRRVADYFVVAGLDKNQQLPLEEFSNEAITKPSFCQDPITDITVINRSLGEKVPKGYECVELTPTGYPANLNHGSLRCPDMFICYKRGRDKPPLKDLGILYEGKERVMEGCEVVHTTLQGHPANVNNSNSSRTYITFRRAEKSAPSDTLVVVDICIILGNRGEEPPLTFLKILKNLNKGMLGSDVYLCYKKAMIKSDVLAYKASILGRYPAEDYEDFPLPESVPMFCLPMGATIECWSAEAQHPIPNFSTFILTGAGGEKVYGAAVSFYEEYREEDLTDMQLRSLGLKNKHIREQYRILKTVHIRKSISLLSHWPFFDAFKKFLSQLYKISITGPHVVPIERHISHFMYDVPYPSPERPRILVQLSHDSLSLCMPEDSPLPQSGASFITLLRNLGPELTMNLLLFVLLESKILLHSLRPTVLTEVAEAVSTMIFPFHWQCPYIPLCPLGLSDVLNAPCPFIVGVDSRYFDLYDPPPDVICVDLDTNRIQTPEDKKSLNFKLLPKKPTRVMQDCLSKLYEKASQPNVLKNDSDEVSLEMAHFDQDFRRRKQNIQLELAIQEAFLRFFASILADYKSYLNPIMKAPNSRATDASSLFDMQGFLKSRDKTTTKFYHQLMITQMFFRFIEERSFVSDKDAGLTFFDECTEKVDETSDEPKLIEIDNTHTSERTVFIMPPEPVGLPEGVKYSYNGFPVLKTELFMSKKKPELSLPIKQLCPNSPLARRTKQEVKSAQKIAMQQVGNPMTWAKCILSYSYSLWFVVFPAFVRSHPKKTEALKIGLAVLRKMQEARLITVDELCYRVLMQLAGQYNKPGMAVQVFSQMKKHGVHPNAITYGYYNKVMLEAKWPSPLSKAHLRWLKIRNVIIGIAKFRRLLRRRSVSIYSNSGSEFDRISHTSADSYLAEAHLNAKADVDRPDVTDANATFVPKETSAVVEDGLKKNSGSFEERMSTGGVSDRGYNSMTKEDLKLLSHIVVTTEDSSRAISSTNSQNCDKTSKSKLESWNPLTSAFLSNSTSKPTEKLKKEVHIAEECVKRRTHRPRVGSIVKRSVSAISSHNHVDDFEMLKGSLLSNACGLVILSQACLERNSFLPDADIRLEVEEAKRRRHRSAGEGHNKPSRSMSLFASWRPPKNNGTADSSDNFDKELKVISYSQSCDRDYLLSSRSGNANISDQSSGDIGSEACLPKAPSDIQKDDKVNKSMCDGSPTSPMASSALIIDHSIAISESSSQDQFVCESENQETKTSPQTVNSIYVKGSSEDIPIVKSALPPPSICHKTAHHSSHEPTSSGSQQDNSSNADDMSDESLVTAADSSTIRHPVSVSDDKLSDHFNVDQASHSLDDTSCSANSTERCIEHRIIEKQTSEDAQSVSSLTDTKTERPNDFVLKRSQSLKKTNETIGNYLKWASQAAYTKFNELKQTITTPIKSGSLGSLGSLTQSVEELDVNDGSSTSGTIRERLQHRGSHDPMSYSEGSETDETERRMSEFSLESGPTPSLDEYSSLREVSSNASSGTGATTDKPTENVKVAMEVEISSCSRCTKCNRLIYDEEIMAGWSAEDSNLNTSCPYCHAKFVPHLQVYIKDRRGDPKSVVVNNELSCSAKEKLLAKSDQQIESNTNAGFTEKETEKVLENLESPLEKDGLILDVDEASTASQRQCSSECVASTVESPLPANTISKSTSNIELPPLLSVEEENLMSSSAPAEDFHVKKEFMPRSPSSCEPIVVPYLSPLVLRKEVEYILEHEGDLCLAADAFVEEHPIIFWNLTWFFCRIEVPTHLTAFLLSSKAFSCNKPENVARYKDIYSCQNISIRPQWDNVRIHDEVGLPMYSAWQAGHKSTVVDALVIDSDSFTRPLMWQIIASIKRNDVFSGIRLIAGARLRMASRKRRFRSMYREILFLSFAACGRENIDHDAFDREYAAAFSEKLQKSEKDKLQADDFPKADNVQWCRKLFSELEM